MRRRQVNAARSDQSPGLSPFLFGLDLSEGLDSAAARHGAPVVNLSRCASVRRA